MKYERLLEIATSIAAVVSENVYEEHLWRQMAEMKTTTREIQEIGLTRYEIYPIEEYKEDDRIVIWDNLILGEIEGLVFHSKKDAMEEIERIIKRDLEQEECSKKSDGRAEN